MRSMENLEYSTIVAELQTLIGKHFSNIQMPGEGKYRLRIGSTDILAELGKRLYITRYIEEPLEADQFAKKVKKELDNSRLVSVEQKNNDRIVVFEFECGKDESGKKQILSLIFEMFAKGNAIIISGKDNTTIAAYREEKWADREIKRNKIYSFPKSNIAVNINDARKTSPGKYIVVCLMKLPLGKIYVKELLAKCGIDEKKPENGLTEKESDELEREFKNITGTKGAFVFVKEGSIVDYGVCPLAIYADAIAEKRKTISEAADDYYFKGKEPEIELKKSEKLQKLERRLAEQEKTLIETLALEKELKETGEFIYGNYETIEQVLSEAKKIGIQNVESQKGVSSKLKITDKKKKEIEIEL